MPVIYYCLREIVKNVIVHRLVIGEGISYSIVFCIFVFIACVFLPSRINRKCRHNASLYIFHLSLSSCSQSELRIRLISASNHVKWVLGVCILLVLAVLSEFCGIAISFDSSPTNDVGFWRSWCCILSRFSVEIKIIFLALFITFYLTLLFHSFDN